MKEARDAEGGESRREVEKTWGRNEAGRWEILHEVDTSGNAAKRDDTPGRTALKGSARKEGENTPKRAGRTRE
jgi:hypothetical protein